MTRQALALAGILLGALGLAYGNRVVVWIATAILTAAVAWRLLDSRRRGDPPTGGGDRGS
jgi:hypothetical protein